MSDIKTLFQPEILQGLLGGIGDGFILTDTQENILYINHAAGQMLEYEEHPGRMVTFSEVCPLVDVTNGHKYLNPLRLAITEKRSVGLARNIGVLGANGPVYLSATCSPIMAASDKDQVLGASVILRDVTRMRELEAKVELDRHYMRAVFSAAKVGLCILNADGEIVDINETGLNIMETTAAESLGLQVGDAFHCENSLEHGCGHGMNCRHCPVRNNLEAAIMDDEFSSEFNVLMRSSLDRRVVWLKVCISQTGHGRAKQIIVALVDESARKLYERQLEEAKMAAEEASRTKTQFLSNMSHEIRTPINGMLGMMELALREPLSDKQQICLHNARQCSEDLLRIINDILDFSKLESGHAMLETINFDLHKTIMRIAGTYSQLTQAKGLKMVTPDVKALPRFVRGDPLRLRQIFHNLLSNALKFTAVGEIAFQATVGTHREHPSLDFEIRDTGIGMDEAARKKLFKPFSQGDSSTTRRFGGTGLGLMIVRELLDHMGGDILVESEPGIGSSFRFWIPLVEASSADEERRDRSVFLNPHPEGTVEAAQDTADQAPVDIEVDDLMAYCLQKLQRKD